jgi:cytochrome c553
MKKEFKLTTLVLSLALLSACGSEHMKVPGENSNSGAAGGNSSVASAAGSSASTFSSVKPIFQAKCSSCHGAGKANPKDWLDADVASSNKELIFQRAIVQKNMPLGGSLSVSEAQLIAAWAKGSASKDSTPSVALPIPNQGGVTDGSSPVAVPVVEVPSPTAPNTSADLGSASPEFSGEVSGEVPVTEKPAEEATQSIAPPASAGLCFGCHGVAGISAVPLYPNLAGQKKEYMIKQLKDFKAGVRKDPMMNTFSSGLSEEDMQALADYFSKLKAE